MCRKYFVLLGLMLFIVSSCAHLPGARKSEKGLRQRVVKEWEAKLNDDWGTVYDLTAKRFKNAMKREKFVGGTTIEVERYVIQGIEIDPAQEKAWAQVMFDIRHMGLSFKGAKTKEEWIWEDGNWRLNLDPHMSPFR
jgi:hypothetical protein